MQLDFENNDDDDFIINNNNSPKNNNNNTKKIKNIFKNSKNIKRKGENPYIKLEKEEFFKLDGVRVFLKRKVIEFKNLIDKKFKYKIFIQKTYLWSRK